MAFGNRRIGRHLFVDFGGNVGQVRADEIVEAIAVFFGYLGGFCNFFENGLKLSGFPDPKSASHTFDKQA